MSCTTGKFYACDNIEVTLNDDFYQIYQLTDSTGAIDITSYVIKLGIKQNQTDTTYLIAPITASILSQVTNKGYFVFNIQNSTLFPTLAIGTYYYSIEVTDTAGITTTRIKGEFKVSWEGA